MGYRYSRTRSGLTRQVLLACTLWVFASPAFAIMVDLGDEVLDSLYGASNFGADAIDIRFIEPVDYRSETTLANIDSRPVWNALHTTALGLDTDIVRMFVVDSIGWCSNTGTFAGCGDVAGNVFAVDVDRTDDAIAQNIYGHELGHTLGLEHVTTSGNLMRSSIKATNVDLIPDQVATVLGNPALTIQFDGNQQRFIEIAPIFVSERAVAAIPLPGALVMCSSALALLGAAARRRRG